MVSQSDDPTKKRADMTDENPEVEGNRPMPLNTTPHNRSQSASSPKSLPVSIMVNKNRPSASPASPVIQHSPPNNNQLFRTDSSSPSSPSNFHQNNPRRRSPSNGTSLSDGLNSMESTMVSQPNSDHLVKRSGTKMFTGQPPTTSFASSRKRTFLKASPMISPLLLPQSLNEAGSRDSGNLTNNLNSLSEQPSEQSVMSYFSAWEDYNSQVSSPQVDKEVFSSGVYEVTNRSSSPSVAATTSSIPSYLQDDTSNRSTNVSKSRKFTTFISKIFGRNDGMNSEGIKKAPKRNVLSSLIEDDSSWLAMSAPTDFHTTDSVTTVDPSDSKLNNTSVSDAVGENDLETRQKNSFTQWFHAKSMKCPELFEKEGCVYFYKKSIKPQAPQKKRSSTQFSAALPLDESTEPLPQSNDVFVERFISCKNQVVTIFEKGSKDSPVKHSISWNQNVTYSVIPTEKSFDTIFIKQQKKKVKLTKNEYYLFEIRVEQSDNHYVMDPLILVGCIVGYKQEREDWIDLFEIYSIYSSLNVFSDENNSLTNKLTSEDLLRDDLIQEYELFNEYQHEVSEQSSDGQLIQHNKSTSTSEDVEAEPIVINSQENQAIEESKAFQREMEKSYLFLINSFDLYSALDINPQPFVI